MDNEKLDRLEGKFDRMLLLMEHMDKDISELKQGQQELKQDVSVLKQQNAALTEAINVTNQNLTSKIDALDKKFDEKFNILEGQTNVNTIDITRLRAAK